MSEALPRSVVAVPICIEPDDTGYVGYSPNLGGCAVGGQAREEVWELLLEAAHLASYIQHGAQLPSGCRLVCGIPVSGAVSRGRHMDTLHGMAEKDACCEKSDILVPM
ncbi:MAG: type II toxin-antitoxin system HicB family antitoxin [Candidatus Bipolaricaulis sp.]|nr:type II toxin-antitoxin system HicB family antitoxin [Candidatus Bipolaricaulis sp.]